MISVREERLICARFVETLGKACAQAGLFYLFWSVFHRRMCNRVQKYCFLLEYAILSKLNCLKC